MPAQPAPPTTPAPLTALDTVERSTHVTWVWITLNAGIGTDAGEAAARAFAAEHLSTTANPATVAIYGPALDPYGYVLGFDNGDLD